VYEFNLTPSDSLVRPLSGSSPLSVNNPQVACVLTRGRQIINQFLFPLNVTVFSAIKEITMNSVLEYKSDIKSYERKQTISLEGKKENGSQKFIPLIKERIIYEVFKKPGTKNEPSFPAVVGSTFEKSILKHLFSLCYF
jgi:hypothetical protein